MEAYFSYWSKGYSQLITDFTLSCHKISAYFAKKHFKKVHLITDSLGKESLKTINWDSITTDLDELDPLYAPTWSLGKLKAYDVIAKRGNPFIHIDYDVFLTKPLVKSFLDAGVFAQSPEDVVHYRYETQRISELCPNLHWAKYVWPKNALNVGIFGGNDLTFIGKYATESLKLVLDPKNKNFWTGDTLKEQKFIYHWAKAAYAEQFYLGVIAKLENKEVKLLFPEGWPTEEQATEAGYIHLMGAKARTYDGTAQTIFQQITKVSEKYIF